MPGPLDTSSQVTSQSTTHGAAEEGCGCRAATRSDFLDWVGRLVHQHRETLARVARREGLAPEDAFDAVQEAFYAFLTLPSARGLVDDREGSRRLLITLARNVARNRRRLHALARPHERGDAVVDALPDQGATVEELVAAAEDQVRLQGCVSSLAEVQRAVVTLRLLDEVPGDDVARELGITSGHVAVLLHRAKANLLACMTTTGGNDVEPTRP